MKPGREAGHTENPLGNGQSQTSISKGFQRGLTSYGNQLYLVWHRNQSGNEP